MPTQSRRCHAIASLVFPLALGGLPVQALALAPSPPLPPPSPSQHDVVHLKNGG